MDFEKKRETRFGEAVKLKRDLREKRGARLRERLRNSKRFEREERTAAWREVAELGSDLRKKRALRFREAAELGLN